MRLLYQSVLRHAADRSGHLAIVHDEKQVTYRELGQAIESAANTLHANGVRIGDRIILSAIGSPEFVSGYLAAHMLGAVAVPVSPDIPLRRLEYITEQVQPEITLGANTAGVRNLPLDALLDSSLGHFRHSPPPDIPASRVADIMFTTGTTGVPKGVVLTHGNITAAISNINTFIGTTGDDREVVPLPLSHSFGLGRMRCLLFTGGTMILTDGLRFPGRVFKAIDQWSATGFSSVPAGFAVLFGIAADKIGDYAATLRYIEIGSAPMPLDNKQRLMSLLPDTRICMHYGLTEASRAAFMEFHEAESLGKLMSIGRPAPNVEIAVLGEDGSQNPPGEPGRLAVRGDVVTNGYWQNGAAVPTLDENAWLHTGDTATRDDDGWLWLLGREGELIDVGGRKVSPVEVENALMEIDGIADGACIGVQEPAGLGGEIVKAFLVAEPGSARRPSNTDIYEALRIALEPYQIPTDIEWVTKIPKTQSGKMLRQDLRSATVSDDD